MQTEEIIGSVEAAVEAQLALGDGGEAVEAAAAAVLAALRPAFEQAALQLAEQAAAEVAAQLDGYTVSVIIEEGEPSLLVREDADRRRFTADDLSARITLRLPDALKDDLETAASELGDSVNAYVIKALSSRASRRTPRRYTETFDT